MSLSRKCGLLCPKITATALWKLSGGYEGSAAQDVDFLTPVLLIWLDFSGNIGRIRNGLSSGAAWIPESSGDRCPLHPGIGHRAHWIELITKEINPNLLRHVHPLYNPDTLFFSTYNFTLQLHFSPNAQIPIFCGSFCLVVVSKLFLVAAHSCISYIWLTMEKVYIFI